MKNKYLIALAFLFMSLTVISQVNTITGAYTIKEITTVVSKYEQVHKLFQDTLKLVFNEKDTITYSISKSDSIRKYIVHRKGSLLINNDKTFIGYLGIEFDKSNGVSTYRTDGFIEGTGKIGVTKKNVILCYDGKQDCITLNRRDNQLILKRWDQTIVLIKE